MSTRYVETDALVCAMERHEDGAKERLRQLTKRERHRLYEALERLSNWIDEVDEEPSGDGTLAVKKV